MTSRASTSTLTSTPLPFEYDFQQDSQDDTISFDSSMFVEDIPPVTMDVSEPSSSSSTYYKRKRNNTDEVDKEIISCIKTLTKQKTEQKCDDADELFAKTITAMLKNFPKNIKNEAKVYIMTYLTDIDTAI